MKRNYKVGDRVMLISGMYGDYNQNPVWSGSCGKIKGTVTRIPDDFNGRIDVTWDNKLNNNYRESDLELVEPSDWDE